MRFDVKIFDRCFIKIRLRKILAAAEEISKTGMGTLVSPPRRPVSLSSRSSSLPRRYSGGNRGGDSGVGSSGGGFSGGSSMAGGRRASRPTATTGGAVARPQPANPNLLGAAAALPGGDSDEEGENIYTSEFTVV